MRKIRFRGRDFLHKTWIYGGIVEDSLGNIVILPQEKWSNGRCIDESTVGQFTGLYDKNGHEIYEGDILRSDYYPFSNEGHNNYLGEVRWVDEKAWYGVAVHKCRKSDVNGLYGKSTYRIDKAMALQYEVIGNIHDNPNLWEE